MKVIVVGGNFGEQKESSVIKKLSDVLSSDVINGGNIEDIEIARRTIVDYDLVIWAPNISNEVSKHYPVKKTGSVLICSKLLHDDVGIGDAVARIFKMNANAVIAIDTVKKPFVFKLVDALGNLWVETSDLSELSKVILMFYKWNSTSIRVGTNSCEDVMPFGLVSSDFCDLIRIVAQKVEKERGGRYFGNASTRCKYTFPSLRVDDYYYFSGRNMPKDYIKPEDFVYVNENGGKIYYDIKSKKPSVDTPVQLELYKLFPNIKYMIHGHAYIKDVSFTKHYFPCGDLREVDSIKEVVNDFDIRELRINLKNHGFLICADNLETLGRLVYGSEFEYKIIEERVEF